MISPRLRLSTKLLAALLTASSVLAVEPIDVVFKAKHDGSEQWYVVILPDDFDNEKPHSVLIALHGHGSDRWQFIKDKRDECRAARDVAAKHKLI